MARSRNIKPGFFKNEILATFPHVTRLLFAGLWTIADKEGRFEVRLSKIKAECFPHEQSVLEPCMAQLWDKQFITLYEVDGKHFGQVINWRRHQSPHHKEADSIIPPCENEKVFKNQEDIYTWLKHESSLIQSRFKESASTPLIPDSLNLIPDSLNPSTSEDEPPDAEEENPEEDPDKFSEEDMRLATWMREKVFDVAPKSKEPNLKKWADTIRLMRERDDRTHREIAEVFSFANSDNFWASNVLSPGKLREKFGELDAKMEANNAKVQRIDQRPAGTGGPSLTPAQRTEAKREAIRRQSAGEPPDVGVVAAYE